MNIQNGDTFFRTNAGIFVNRADEQINESGIKIKLSKEIREFKKDLITRLVALDILDIPNQALLCDWYEYLSTHDLHMLLKSGVEFNIKEAIQTPIAVDGQCHSVTALLWFMNLFAEKPLGYVDIYTGVSCKTFNHSWLYCNSQKVLFEPTSIRRESYYGYKVNDSIHFFEDEVDNIFRLIEDKSIDEEYASRFILKFEKFKDHLFD